MNPFKNNPELAARMLEAALAQDREKITADGRPLWQHDVWRTACSIVGAIRTQKTEGFGANSYYRFKPYLDRYPGTPDLPGLRAAAIVCSNDYGKMSGRNHHDIEHAAEKCLAIEQVLAVMFDTWIMGQDQWAYAAYAASLTTEQREAIHACLDAREVEAAVRTFEAISGQKIGKQAIDELITHTDTFMTMRALGLAVAGPTRRTQPPLQNIPFKHDASYMKKA